MRIARIEKDSLNNGPGVRLVVWCQGCSIRCDGCHNPETWDMFGGRELTNDDIEDIVEYLNKDYVAGITFSGGHPLEWYNLDYVSCVAHEIRKRCPGKTTWLYTGLELDYHKIMSDDRLLHCLSLCDVVVDGPYIKEQRSTTIAFRGSTNQRLIDMKRTLQEKKIILLEEQY